MSTSSIGGSFDLTAKEAYEASRKSTAAAGTTSANTVKQDWRDGKKASSELSFTDMLQLMVVQFQNQTIDNTADTSDMMNQLVQMSVVQAMTGLTTKMEEVAQANILSYSASLVDKMVTVGQWDDKGNLKEIYGRVTGAGTYNGQSVIFLDDGEKPFYLSSIMAVGKLPETNKPEETEDDKKAEAVDPAKPAEDPEKPDDSTDKPVEGTGGTTEGTEKPDDSTDKPVEGVGGSDSDNTGNTGSTGGTDAPGTDSGTDEEPLQI